jgi:hypothetical protein
MRYILAFAFFFFVFSCKMSTEQELSLNKSLLRMVEARNSGDALSYLNFTHPAIVKHYTAQGDSALIKKFQEVPVMGSRDDLKQEGLIRWGEGYTKEVKQNDSILQAEVEIQLYREYELLDSTAIFYATCFKDELDWNFVNESDYGKSYFPASLRLFEEDLN